MGSGSVDGDIGGASILLVNASFRRFAQTRLIRAIVLLSSALFSVPAAAGLHIPLLSGPAQQHIETWGLGDWRLYIVTSRFSVDVQCRLATTNGRMIYTAGALGIRFGKHAPVSQAWVKIGDGTAQRWRDMLPELARLRVPIDGREMDSPTGGMLWIPVTAIEQAGTVAIQLRANQRPRIFSLAQFIELRDAGHRLGCEPEARFIR